MCLFQSNWSDKEKKLSLIHCLHYWLYSLCVLFFILHHFIFFHFGLQHLDIVSPFQLYFNPTLIVLHYQVWRLITTFLFFGTIGFNFLFNMTFTYRYCRMLEEGSFRGKSSDFIMMFIFGGALMIVSSLFLCDTQMEINGNLCTKKIINVESIAINRN